jgi:hypothetical protein
MSMDLNDGWLTVSSSVWLWDAQRCEANCGTGNAKVEL